MEEPPAAETCSVVIADDASDQQTDINTTNTNAATVIVEAAVGNLNAELQKATRRRRWLAIMDQKPKRDSNGAVSLKDKPVEADDSKLEMLVEDAIAALEFDYYVLGVALFRLFTTVGFCVIFAVLLNSGTPNEKMYIQSMTVATTLAPDSSIISIHDTTVQFNEINSVDDVYNWLSDTFIPTVFVTTDHTGDGLPDFHRGHLDLANRVLGGVILDMTPREFKSCDSEFVLLQLYPMCTYVDNSGKTSTFLEINLDEEEARGVIDALRENGTWVNYHSEQLAITVVTYSGVHRHATEDKFPPDRTHHCRVKYKRHTRLPRSYLDNDYPRSDRLHFFGAVLRYLESARPPLIADSSNDAETEQVTPDDSEMSSRRMKMNKTRQVLRLIGEFVLKFGALPAFATLWTVTISLDFDKKLLRLPEVYGKTLDQKESDTIAVIQALDQVEAWTNALSIVGAIAVLQLGLYTIRQLSFHPQLNVFARTVGNSLRQFRDFFLVFIIIFITFSFMGNLLFGDRVSEFSTAALSRESCMNMIFGTFEFSTIYNIRGSGWFYWGYMIIVSLILLNMMLAIVMGTYKGMSKDGYQGEINVMLASRISKIHHYLIQFVLKRKRLPLKHPARTRPSEDNKQAVDDFDAMKMDIYKLEHNDVIAYGKFRPPLLLTVLQTKVQQNSSLTRTTKLTPAVLRQLFPNAEITAEEMIETFKFLKEGFELNEAVTKQGQKKKVLSKASRLAELQQNLHRLMEEMNATHKEIRALTADKVPT